MTRQPRGTRVYRAKEGRETVDIGMTDRDLTTRLAERRSRGQRIDKLVQVGPRLTRPSALEKEQTLLDNFKRNHGRPPKYNKQDE